MCGASSARVDVAGYPRLTPWRGAQCIESNAIGEPLELPGQSPSEAGSAVHRDPRRAVLQWRKTGTAAFRCAPRGRNAPPIEDPTRVRRVPGIGDVAALGDALPAGERL